MNYAVLIVLFIAFVFYYLVRFYLNKFKNLDLPILMERYHDNPAMTIIQAALMMISLLVGYVVASFFF